MKKFSHIDLLLNENAIPIIPGSILQRANGRSLHYTLLGNIFDMCKITPQSVITHGEPYNRVFYNANDTKFDLGATVGNLIFAEKARIRFTNKNNAVIVFNNGITSSLKYGLITNQLAVLWHQNRYVNNHRNIFIVSSVINTNQAKVIYSMQNNTSITVSHVNNQPFNNLNDLINMNINIANEARSVTCIDINTNIPLLLDLIRFDRQNQAFMPFIP